MYRLATKPQSFLQIMRDSFTLYSVAFKRLVFWAIVAGLIDLVMALVTPGHAPAQNAGQASLHFGVFLSPLIVLLLSFIPLSAIFFDIYQTMHNQNPTIKGAFYRAMTSWLSLVGVSVLLVILCVLLAVLGYLGHIVGIVIAILLGVYLAISLFSLFPLIITEQMGIFKAIKNSFKIIKGNWWRTFGLLLLVTIIIFVINTAINVIFTGKFQLDPYQTRSMAQLIVNGVVTIAFIPWLYGVMLLQIHNLELRRK